MNGKISSGVLSASLLQAGCLDWKVVSHTFRPNLSRWFFAVLGRGFLAHHSVYRQNSSAICTANLVRGHLHEISSGWWFGCHFLFSQKYWECHNPNWRSHIFQRGGWTTNQSWSILNSGMITISVLAHAYSPKMSRFLLVNIQHNCWVKKQHVAVGKCPTSAMVLVKSPVAWLHFFYFSW